MHGSKICSMLPRTQLIAEIQICCLFCVVFSHPANNVTALILQQNNASLSSRDITSTPFIPQNSTLSVSVGSYGENNKDNSVLNWTAGEIALRVGVIVVIIVGLVAVIKLTLVIHQRCSTKDELYSHVNAI